MNDGQTQEPAALVKNAADKEQVKKAAMTQKQREIQAANDLRFVLSSRQGRRFIWRILCYCNMFQSIWRPSAEIHKLAGMQEVGLFLTGEITQVDDEAYFLMMKEAKQEAQNG